MITQLNENYTEIRPNGGLYCPMTQNKKFQVFVDHLGSLNRSLNESKD